MLWLSRFGVGSSLALSEGTATRCSLRCRLIRDTWEVRWRPGHPVSYSPPPTENPGVLRPVPACRGPVAEFTCWGEVAATTSPSRALRGTGGHSHLRVSADDERCPAEVALVVGRVGRANRPFLDLAPTPALFATDEPA